MKTGILAAGAAALALAAAAQEAASDTDTRATQAEPAPDAVLAIHEAYVRSANPMTGAAFMVIENRGAQDCTLTGATGDASERIELHTHREVDGVMQMVHVEEGLTIPAGGSRTLERGGDHIMFMGLAQPLAQGDTVALTLDFGACGTLAVEIPVDNLHNLNNGHGGMAAHGH
ncbi:copper chaperone PCu(A)C [Paracoccus sp. S-4012]|uniref:copper chaperone PCu(A)C n=1 Tax=Paracoccus sp. S-4012 TaxID=2665648 RepID=UPI0012B069DE|nr:copper chaperone PCu(A)C [Paracoccus sp. S-4012]MRX49418.1 copper chaperone PCu(A)C [Paracoccus sp. S-4012]